MDIDTIVVFVKAYLHESFSYGFIRVELKLSDTSICDWACFCREVLIEWCLKRDDKIGGKGKIVEIDESKFRKRKHNVGKLVKEEWVFGGVCRQTRQCFMVPVEQKNSTTLLNIIKNHILPGTAIISDCWKTYSCLEDEGYKHLTVNHSINFVNPNNKDAYTSSIKRLWRETKREVPLFGTGKKHFAGYLARTMFLMAIDDSNKRLHVFLQEAAALYNPYNCLQETPASSTST